MPDKTDRKKTEKHEGHIQRYIKENLLFVTVIGLFAVVLLGFALDLLVNDIHSNDRQDALQPFYTPAAPLPAGNPGDIIRSESLGVEVPGGQGVRVLYLSEEADGTPRVAHGKPPL